MEMILSKGEGGIDPGHRIQGRLRLKAEHYVYLGSAMGGLNMRISRQLRWADRRDGARH